MQATHHRVDNPATKGFLIEIPDRSCAWEPNTSWGAWVRSVCDFSTRRHTVAIILGCSQVRWWTGSVYRQGRAFLKGVANSLTSLCTKVIARMGPLGVTGGGSQVTQLRNMVSRGEVCIIKRGSSHPLWFLQRVDPSFGLAPPTMGWTLPHQSWAMQMPYRFAYGPVLWRQCIKDFFIPLILACVKLA